MRRLIPRAMLIFFGVCLASASAELGLALFSPQPYPGYTIADSSGRDLYSPDFKLGRRPLEAPGLQPWNLRSEKAVLMLGDSFTASYMTPLASLLNERHLSDAIQLINGGVQTFGTGQELELYRERWQARRPHWVILGFYIGNDFLDNTTYASFVRRRNAAQRLNLFRLLLRSLGWLRPGNPPGIRPYPETRYGPHFFYKSELERELCVFKQGKGGLQPWENAVTFDDLLSLESEVRRRGGRLAVVLMPRDVQVERSRVLPAYPAPLDLELPNRRLTRLLKAHRIPYLDLLPALRILARSGALYRYQENNIHWNERGAKISARLTLDWLLTVMSEKELNGAGHSRAGFPEVRGR